MLYDKKIGFDYDYIGLSYYPFWDGDFENMQSVVKMIRDEFGKSMALTALFHPQVLSKKILDRHLTNTSRTT